MKASACATALTADTFYRGKIRVMQHRSGYRFGIDAVLLAHYVALQSQDIVLDLGTGCGIIPLILAHRYPGVRIYGVELQAKLARLARLNVSANRLMDRVTIIQEDMTLLARDRLPKRIQVVVCNPPFRRAAAGRLNADSERAIARHELRIRLDDMLQTARRMLGVSGRLVTIYPVERIAEVLSKMHRSAIEPKRARLVYSRRDTGAVLAAIEGIRGGKPGMTIGPPLVIYRADGSYTKEVEEMLRGSSVLPATPLTEDKKKG